MKKSLFFVAAASALMLTACSSESDVVQSAPQAQETAAQAVGFDVYTPAATNVRRAGQAGTMTTGRLQRTHANNGGFGVYAYLVEDANNEAAATDYVTWQNRTTPSKAPNFMVNQEVLWNNTNLGWYYDPLKYWPNETNNDSQNTNAQMEAISGNKHLDRLTFFAYAPYVATGVNEPGITLLTNKKGDLVADPTTETTGTLVEASVGYQTALIAPSSSVDLLWGVAPAGGLHYTSVNGTTSGANEGLPYIDLIKPDVNTSIKFNFQHALARIGVNVVAAIDQVGAGGTLDPNTKITIKEVTLTGKFGETGVLNLDNPNEKVAHWVKIKTNTGAETAINSGTTDIPGTTTLTLNVANNTIAPDLRYAGEHTFGSYSEQTVSGVTTAKKDLITGRYYTLDAIPAYTPSKQYYSDGTGTVAVAKYNAQASDNYYTYTSSTDTYTQVTGDITPAGSYYRVVAGGTYDGTHELTAAVYYTQTECNDYNSTNVSGYIASGSTLSAADAGLVNTALSTSYATDGTAVISEDDANAYNATLPGARKTTDVKTAATYGYDDEALSPSAVLFTRTGSEGSYVYTYKGTKGSFTWDGTAATYCTMTPTALAVTDIAFAYSGTIYDVERNYFMVVPTNNVKKLNDGIDDEVEKALRTIRVKIEYYVTTEDTKIDGGRTQIKNVIEKDVLFPSLANGKSYMLNLVLGLTSVKMDAEVDEWKVVNVQADLPQNTAE